MVLQIWLSMYSLVLFDFIYVGSIVWILLVSKHILVSDFGMSFIHHSAETRI